MNIHIQRLTQEARQDVVHTLAEIDKNITIIGDVWTAAEFQSFQNILVATTPDQKVVGYLVYEIEGVTSKSHGIPIHIYNIGVDLQYQGQGIGTKLLQFTKQLPNVNSITLEVAVSNEKALGLYLKMGFRVEMELPNYYGPGQHAYFARLNLS